MSESPQSSVLTRTNLPDIIRRYADGEAFQDLAKETGVSRVTLYKWILGGVGDADYADIVTNCLVNRVAEADQNLDQADAMINLARAREQAKFARMDLERRRPQLYGPKQETKTDVQITVVIQRLTEEPKTIEMEKTVEEP